MQEHTAQYKDPEMLLCQVL